MRLEFPQLPHFLGHYPCNGGRTFAQGAKCEHNVAICKVTLSSPCLWASFHSLFYSLLSVVSAQSKEIFIKSQYEMLKLSI
jgi:hypothetical protein